VIVVNFQSRLDPFIIVMALPTALAGIVWILFLTHTTLSVPALTGSDDVQWGRDRQQHTRATMKFHWAAIASLPRADRWARASPSNPPGTWGSLRYFHESKFIIIVAMHAFRLWRSST
jgi:hypothetical protein